MCTLGATLGACTRGGRVAGVSCHSVLRWSWLVFFFFWLFPQKMGCQRVSKALWLRSISHRTGGLGLILLVLTFFFFGGGTRDVDRTTWGHLWGRQWDLVQIRSSCSTFLAWPECASRRCICAKWQCEAGSKKENQSPKSKLSCFKFKASRV